LQHHCYVNISLFPIHATCLNHPFLIIHRDDHKSRSLSLCSFIRPPVTSSLLGPNIFLSTPFLKTLSLNTFLLYERGIYLRGESMRGTWREGSFTGNPEIYVK